MAASFAGIGWLLFTDDCAVAGVMRSLFFFALGFLSFGLLLEQFLQWAKGEAVLCDGGEGQTGEADE